MKGALKQIIESEKNREKEELPKSQNIENKQDNSRRNFLRKAAFGGIALGGLMHA